MKRILGLLLAVELVASANECCVCPETFSKLANNTEATERRQNQGPVIFLGAILAEILSTTQADVKSLVDSRPLWRDV